MPRNVEICPCCGQKIVEYKHNFNAVLLNDLRYLEGAQGVSTLHDLNETTKMTASEYANFQKLQYFGVVRKDGPTYYLTQKGKDFLNGKGGVPRYVSTRKKIVVEEGPEIKIDGNLLPVQTVEDWQDQASL